MLRYVPTPPGFYATWIHPQLRSALGRDHLHVLFSLNKNQPLAQVVMELKRATSKWLKTKGAEFANFHWQAGYGAFSIGQSGVEEARAYIANQPEHHRRKTFQEELRALLKLYALEFDERHLWD